MRYFVMDWKKIIAELQQIGLTQSDIGRALGKSQAWVADVVSGRYVDLKWADGEALKTLHAAHCPPVGADDTPSPVLESTQEAA